MSKQFVSVWSGAVPSKCDICTYEITDQFFDCRIPRIGSWACICLLCFNQENCKLGTGHGQEYSKQGNDFIKTGG